MGEIEFVCSTLLFWSSFGLLPTFFLLQSSKNDPNINIIFGCPYQEKYRKREGEFRVLFFLLPFSPLFYFFLSLGFQVILGPGGA